LGDSGRPPRNYVAATASHEGVREDAMTELTLLLVFALYAGVMGLIFQVFGK
jgi:hypothetical protein